jgi:hypothetical protein
MNIGKTGDSYPCPLSKDFMKNKTPRTDKTYETVFHIIRYSDHSLQKEFLSAILFSAFDGFLSRSLQETGQKERRQDTRRGRISLRPTMEGMMGMLPRAMVFVTPQEYSPN